MDIKISFNGTDETVIAQFESMQGKILNRLAERMTTEMQKLQERARTKASESTSKYPENPKDPLTGALADSIQNPRAEVEGDSVVGKLDWGEGVPYARVQEEGLAQLPAINPLGRATGLTGPFQKRGGTYKKGIGRVYGADVLQFMGSDGEFAYSKYSFPGAIPAKHFMANALQESIDDIVAGMSEAIETGGF